MATSGSVDLATSGAGICRAAYRINNNASSAYTLTSEEMADYLEALNFLVKNLMGPPSYVMKGVKTWQKEFSDITIKAQIYHDIMPTGGDHDLHIPAQIIACNYKDNSSQETPLRYMSLEEYNTIPDKTATGTPVRYHDQRRLDRCRLYLDVVPQSSIVGHYLTIEYLKPLEDFDSLSNEPYFPQEWYRPLKWLLAREMSPEVGRSIPADVQALAGESLENAQKFNNFGVNLSFEPDNPDRW